MKRRRRYRPPRKVARIACKGLKQRQAYGRGGTQIGVTRGHQLCKQKTVSLNTVKRMDRFFDRHSAFKEFHGKSPPANSEISWNLWGGEPGRKWAKKIVDQEEKK